jgi:hypothetical protein
MSYTSNISNTQPIAFYESKEDSTVPTPSKIQFIEIEEPNVRSAKSERFLIAMQKLTNDFVKDATVEIAANEDPEKRVKQLEAVAQVSELVNNYCLGSNPK